MNTFSLTTCAELSKQQRRDAAHQLRKGGAMLQEKLLQNMMTAVSDHWFRLALAEVE